MKVSIEKQSDGSYIAYNTDGDKCTLIGTGGTVKESKEDFFNSIKEAKNSYTDCGAPIPAELTTDVEFWFDISSLFEYYSIFNVNALGRYLGISPKLMRQYKKGVTRISDTQLEKIEAGIHSLGNELSKLSLI